jgi:hypothetical protein
LRHTWTSTSAPRVGAPHALILIGGLVIGLGVLWLTFRPHPVGANIPGTRGGDVALFSAIVADMKAGASYYDAFGSQMRARGYPTRSPFNWRQPLLYPTLAVMPSWLAQVALGLLGAGLIVGVSLLLRRETWAVFPMLNTVVGLVMPASIYLTEAWAGALIGLSVLAFARDRHRTGAALGLSALFVRELAGPYCALAVILAWRPRRWPELRVWALGFAGYALYYGLHLWRVSQHALPTDHDHPSSWVAFGGLSFLLQTWQANGLLLILPPAVLAFVAVGVVVAWWAPAPTHLRAAVVLYSGLFLVIGQPFNQYWGLLTAPLMSLWLAYAPSGWRALRRAA